jgi:acyl carrier protein
LACWASIQPSSSNVSNNCRRNDRWQSKRQLDYQGRDAIINILADIAPDEDLTDLKDEISFRDQMELDSMDFLDIVMELRKRYRVQVPEEDYTELNSMQSTVNYLTPKMAAVG